VLGEDERVGLLAAIDCVDHVFVFDDRTAAGLVRRIRPDVEAETARQVGSRVVILSRTLPASTTSLIERVHALAGRDGTVGSA
jgi:D-beta-D-heptose 7-phosphate kinase / D-beta-D-heptose 1-phosphate adenosyltransferase